MIKWDELNFRTKRFLCNFEKKFSFLKDKNIVLYGIGEYTEYVLSFYDFNVYGLLDKDPEKIGDKVNGVPIISLDSAIQDADAIIIMTFTQTYWNIIYERIADQVGDRIPVYYPNGTRAIRSMQKDLLTNEYLSKSAAELRKEIDVHDVISFDIFDTLIMRKVIHPKDIWKLLQIYCEEFGINVQNLSCLRESAERILKEKNPYYTIYDIYDWIQSETGCTTNVKKQLLKQEIELERKFIVPRDAVKELFEYASQSGKEIYLISDMYLPETILRKILQDIIQGEFKLWVSCDKKASKANTMLWQLLKQTTNGKNVLHIGDNLEKDINNAKKFEIDTYFIYSSYEMALHSSLRNFLIKNEWGGVGTAISMGMILAKYFNDPFALKDKKGVFIIDDFAQMGYVTFGTMVNSFIDWMDDMCRTEKLEALLFMARDGYLLFKLYEKYSLYNNVRPGYLKISRMLILVLNIYDFQDIKNLLKLPYIGKIKDLLYYRFGLTVDDEDDDLVINTTTDYDFLLSKLKKYEKRIIENSKDKRVLYLNYLNNLKFLNKITGVVDIGYTGTAQYYLEKILQKPLHGYYVHLLDTEDNPYLKKVDMCGMYVDTEETIHCITKHTTSVEAVFTSPEGMYIGIREDGSLIQDRLNVNQLIYDKKEKIHEGIEEFIIEFRNLTDFVKERNRLEAKLLGDQLIGFLFDNSSCIDEAVKKTFWYDHAYSGIKEKPILE